jgi:glycosyltransferase involved in cell wall biosynthesis
VEGYSAALRAMIRELRLERVVLAGHVEHDELLGYYSVADIFLSLSEHEGFGVPLVEAMELGVPVIAYDAGAVAETLQGGGALLKDKPPELVAELVHRLVSDQDLRRAVLATQEKALEKLHATDFSVLLMERLAPVLGAGEA